MWNKAGSVLRVPLIPRWAQDRPFDFAQDRSFDFAQDRPFDFAQDRF